MFLDMNICFAYFHTYTFGHMILVYRMYFVSISQNHVSFKVNVGQSYLWNSFFK